MQMQILPENYDEKLYEGVDITVLQSYLTIHHHFDKFKPSREERTSILRLIALHCPPDNRCFRSIHLFDQFINNGGGTYSTIHEYCGRCHRLFADNELHCLADGTRRYDQGEAKKDFFVMFNLEVELRTRCLDPLFWNSVQHPFNRVKADPNAIEDIYDGQLYPQNTVPGQLHALSSTDGIKVFKTNNNDLWVVMLVILELPPSVR